ncbi:MAG TPA: hypothetical protein VK851_08755 [Anaerolineales bacterium]|nr:hypothetical protein [Anaerolineales bacterium]
MDRLALKTQRTMNVPRLYEIRVVSHLSANWAMRFEGLSMRHESEGETVLSGMLDQAALHGVFVKIRNLGLYLISVNPVEAVGSSHPSAGSKQFQTKGEMKNE